MSIKLGSKDYKNVFNEVKKVSPTLYAVRNHLLNTPGARYFDEIKICNQLAASSFQKTADSSFSLRSLKERKISLIQNTKSAEEKYQKNVVGVFIQFESELLSHYLLKKNGKLFFQALQDLQEEFQDRPLLQAAMIEEFCKDLDALQIKEMMKNDFQKEWRENNPYARHHLLKRLDLLVDLKILKEKEKDPFYEEIFQLQQMEQFQLSGIDRELVSFKDQKPCIASPRQRVKNLKAILEYPKVDRENEINRFIQKEKDILKKGGNLKKDQNDLFLEIEECFAKKTSLTSQLIQAILDKKEGASFKRKDPKAELDQIFNASLSEKKNIPVDNFILVELIRHSQMIQTHATALGSDVDFMIKEGKIKKDPAYLIDFSKKIEILIREEKKDSDELNIIKNLYDQENGVLDLIHRFYEKIEIESKRILIKKIKKGIEEGKWTKKEAMTAFDEYRKKIESAATEKVNQLRTTISNSKKIETIDPATRITERSDFYKESDCITSERVKTTATFWEIASSCFALFKEWLISDLDFFRIWHFTKDENAELLKKIDQNEKKIKPILDEYYRVMTLPSLEKELENVDFLCTGQKII